MLLFLARRFLPTALICILFWWGCLQPTPRPSVSKPLPETIAATESLARLENYAIECSDTLIGLADPIDQIVDSLQALKLMFSSQPRKLLDCSGIFHRVLFSLRKYCPEVELPDVQTARSSRTIAEWYAKRDELILIYDELAQANLIKPGAVLFYGRRKRRYRNLSLARMLREVRHLGVVVSVEKDENENVTAYELFHGRSRGKPASVTRNHFRKPTHTKLPPFGNWDQQWIAFARLSHPSSH